jgi:adenylate cyclase
VTLTQPAPNPDLPEESSLPPVLVNLYVQTQLVFETELLSRLVLGRQRKNELAPYLRIGNRIIIAKLKESAISREHVSLENVSGGEVRITNLSRVNTLMIGNNDLLEPGQQQLVRPPALVMLGDRIIQLESVHDNSDTDPMESLPHQTLPPGRASSQHSSMSWMGFAPRTDEETQYLLRGLHATVGLFQLASNSDDFLQMAVRAMVDVMELETASAIMWKDGDWHTEAICSRQDSPVSESEWIPSRRILQRVRDEHKTFWRVPDGAENASLLNVKALVAAPIMNRKAEVVGALYGDRRRARSGELNLEITELEAILVEMLSTSVASGLARLEQEQETLKARVLFEQFFTPELSRQLEAEPDLLLGHDTEVTLLFCDIRRFSEVSETLGARLTIDWIHDVMETLSNCVAEYQGVLVDTLGDQLSGMWGAPEACPEHAEQACRAAIAMVEQLPGLNRRWQSVLEQPMALGIGLHTGVARVGNIGSTRKFKYGPLGSTVRIASHTEQATRELGTQILITQTTAAYLDDDFATRRLLNLDTSESTDPIELFELAAEVPDGWVEMKRCYELALNAYDEGDVPNATRLLAKILADHPSDRVSLQLLSRINSALNS